MGTNLWLEFLENGSPHNLVDVLYCWQAIPFGFWVPRNDCVHKPYYVKHKILVLLAVMCIHVIFWCLTSVHKHMVCKTDCMLHVLISMWFMCFCTIIGWTLSLKVGLICAKCFLIVFIFLGVFIVSCWTICCYKYMDYWMIYWYMLDNRAYVAKN